jgi:hypothetical protein
VLRARVSRDSQTAGADPPAQAIQEVAMLRLKQLLELPATTTCARRRSGRSAAGARAVFATRVVRWKRAADRRDGVSALSPRRLPSATRGGSGTGREPARGRAQGGAGRADAVVSFTSNYSRIAYPTTSRRSSTAPTGRSASR